ncbi:MAG TPA: hypothetical protein ENI80_03245 [Acidiferrobacteraceae bacterium]|nr:hypothetical protein [Acidiferrobacteraceae bacterium]
MGVYSVSKLIGEARRLARDYRQATGKSLGGISAEIAQYDAAEILGLEVVQGQAGGYDAIGKGERKGKKIQIKGRVVFDEKKSGQRVGQIKIDQEWDSVLLVLMDDQYESCEIYEAQRDDILAELSNAKGGRRSRRGAISVAKFKNIGRLVWDRELGIVGDEIWDNIGGA